MRNLPNGLAAHLAQTSTTTCHAWRLTRTDGQVLGFTEHDHDLAFDGTVFSAATGFRASEVESGLGLEADAANVAGAFSDAAISTDDLALGHYDGARVEIFLVNWQRPGDHVLLSTRQLGEVRSAGQAFTVELRSLAAQLDQPQGRLYGRRCDADLGDARCTKNISPAPYRLTGSLVEAVDEMTLIVSGLSGRPAGWFSDGRIRFATGLLAGLQADISHHTVEPGGARLALWAPLARLPQPGDQLDVSAGCDKAFETCSAKFANGLNFQGFPYLPGSDFAYGYADADTVHDGRPIVP
ncbi:uncharacterized phage protein (TIGR02218 family) [Hoeflea halophila]|uniref:Uncharacterized phage protein (TIGR02218 family) n=1 Tax=Hoeflea halophila TaxID=714899 RepID=A0A286IBE4_9HYPH|nr:DUF2163 domain-containing protein [Hoeflea halophila]SOE17463.1 uncharacterized phage protein (TIGR02218 family) [Hoeflea halophila]